MSETLSYRVRGMSCAHCTAAVERELRAVSGIEDVRADLETKLVTITGSDLDDGTIRAAIDHAGYEAE